MAANILHREIDFLIHDGALSGGHTAGKHEHKAEGCRSHASPRFVVQILDWKWTANYTIC
jgi:hypothetical protein